MTKTNVGQAAARKAVWFLGISQLRAPSLGLWNQKLFRENISQTILNLAKNDGRLINLT